MLKPAYPAQIELKIVTLEQLVPKNHLLRFIDHYIRFDFIRTETESLFCPNNGRPAIDPVVLFKMLFTCSGFVPNAGWCAKSRATLLITDFSVCS
jgi:transposase